MSGLHHILLQKGMMRIGENVFFFRRGRGIDYEKNSMVCPARFSPKKSIGNIFSEE